MKILLVCAGGMSTGILMKKMEAYWRNQNVELEIKAVGLSEYTDVCTNYDIVLIGPQVAYRKKEVESATGLPCEAIPSFEYATADCQKIMKLAKKLYESK